MEKKEYEKYNNEEEIKKNNNKSNSLDNKQIKRRTPFDSIKFKN